MDLQSYLQLLRKRWLSVVIATVLAVGAAVALTLTTTPTYEASTQLYVSVQGGATVDQLSQGANFSRQQVTSYVQMVNTSEVLNPVMKDLSVPGTANNLAKRVHADSPLNTSLLNITVSDVNPDDAAAIANAIGAEFRDFVGTLEAASDNGTSPVKVSVVRPAEAPTAPSSPNLKLNLALGLVLGLALGVAFAIVRDILDTRIRTAQDVERLTSISVIGSISFDADAPEQPLIVLENSLSPRSEAFKHLRTSLQFLNIADRPKSIVVTSSVPGEGKSSITINLAIALAQAGTRVALVDADLRRPSVARYMGLEGSVGLTTVLIGRAKIADVMQPFGDGNLHVLTSGQVPPNPSELLGSEAMAATLAELTRSYDMVLVDTAPLLPVTDAAILSKFTGGALLVAAVGKVHRNQIQQAIAHLNTVDARILGIVINQQIVKDKDRSEYYEYTPEGAASKNGSKGRKSSRKPPRPSTGTGKVVAARGSSDKVLARHVTVTQAQPPVQPQSQPINGLPPSIAVPPGGSQRAYAGPPDSNES